MFKILDKKWLTEDICLMEVYAPYISEVSLPGQFLIIRSSEKGERIPLTICDSNTLDGSITIVFQVLGESTKLLGEREVEEEILDIVGPLGHESELTDLEKVSKNKKYLFIAGGVGVAPIYPQIKWMKENGVKVDAILGFRSKKNAFFVEEVRELVEDLYITTDDGSFGRKGKVTDELSRLIVEEGKKYDEIICIGPLVMMKYVVEKTREYNIKTTVSLNPLMIDGTGMCGACRVTIGEKIKFACVDGPEFDGHKVNFDEVIKRHEMYKSEEGRNYLEKVEGDSHHSHTCNCHEKKDTKRNFKRIENKMQLPRIRVKNFDEVSLTYDRNEAIEEASRCLECKNAKCIDGCPVSIDIPSFISEIKDKNFEDAANKIYEKSIFPSICGRVCPQESQCEKNCILGIKGDPVAIGRLERFVGDYAIDNNIRSKAKEKNDKKVGVVGSGPAGLAAASELLRMGYHVVIYEALHELGGVLTYGIPEFRLPKEKIVEKEIENIKKLGAEIRTNSLIGKTFTIDDLIEKRGFEAVFIGSGAGLPNFMGIPGENANGVFSANEFLTRINLMKAHREDYHTPVKIGEKAVVVGGGNVAMDAARTALRLGADTIIVYRRGMEELPARKEEVEHAIEEGVEFKVLSNPKEILVDENGWVNGVKCIKMALGEPDESGRRRPEEVTGSEFIIETNSVILAIGTRANRLIQSKTKDIETNRWDSIVTRDKSHMTSKEGVFAGGDAVTGAATVIEAMAAGKGAAHEIDEYIKEKK